MSDNSNNVFVEDIKLIADDLSGFFDELEDITQNDIFSMEFKTICF